MSSLTIFLLSYNHSKYLREAIDSVLDQTYSDFELVIWDDSSSDNSWDIIQSYTDPRVRSIRNEVNSAGFGYIPLIQQCKSEFIGIHHSDDVWERSKLEKQLQILESNSDYAAVFTQVELISEDGSPFAGEAHPYSSIFDRTNRDRFAWLNYFFLSGNCLCHPSVVMRRADYEKAGGYRYGLYQLGDFDLWVRLCLKRDLYIVPERLTKFRIREFDANSSANTESARARIRFELCEILKNYRALDDEVSLFNALPEARQFHSPNGFNAEYLLAMTAFSRPDPSFKLFAVEVLFDLMNHGPTADLLKNVYNFDSVTFSGMTASHDIFAHEALRGLAQRISEQTVQLNLLAHKHAEQIAVLETSYLRLVDVSEKQSHQISERDKIIGDLTKSLSDIMESTAWRVGLSVSKIGVRLRSLIPGQKTPASRVSAK